MTDRDFATYFAAVPPARAKALPIATTPDALAFLWRLHDEGRLTAVEVGVLDAMYLANPGRPPMDLEGAAHYVGIHPVLAARLLRTARRAMLRLATEVPA